MGEDVRLDDAREAELDAAGQGAGVVVAELLRVEPEVHVVAADLGLHVEVRARDQVPVAEPHAAAGGEVDRGLAPALERRAEVEVEAQDRAGSGLLRLAEGEGGEREGRDDETDKERAAHGILRFGFWWGRTYHGRRGLPEESRIATADRGSIGSPGDSPRLDPFYEPGGEILPSSCQKKIVASVGRRTAPVGPTDGTNDASRKVGPASSGRLLFLHGPADRPGEVSRRPRRHRRVCPAPR